MPEPSSSQSVPPARSSLRDAGASDPGSPRAALARAIPRRPGVSWWLGIVLAFSFAALVTPAITTERWLLRFHAGTVVARQEAPFTVRAPMLAGYESLRVRGGVVVARGDVATRDEAAIADAIAEATPQGSMLYLALFALTFVLAAIFTHHIRRSTKGRLIRVQVVSLAGIVVLAAAVKVVMASTAVSALVVPVAVIAMVPTMVLDRIVGLATGVLAALVVSLLAPFDVGLAILLLVQVATAGLVISERPKRRWVAALGTGLAATVCTGATYVLLTYLTTGQAPELRDPLHSPWLAAAIGPALAAVLAVPLIPVYQLLVGEITQGKLFALEDLGHPLLRQIAERSPGTWQHSLMMANMADIAANAIGANGRLVRVGAYFHDLGKSLQSKYFIENLEPGETSPHDQLPPEVSCDAIFSHVTDGIAAARRAGLHERIVDFMHMHHGNGVLEYFWAKCREQGNPNQLTIEQFRYPGHPPQSRETALLAICDAVEAASRTLKKPDAAAIDSLVQRIVYGKLHLGQLDESGLSMGDLRRISDSLRETIRHANHGRIEYPWQKAGQDASASVMSIVSTSPRLDSLDRKPGRERVVPAALPPPDGDDSDDALAATADVKNPGVPGPRDPAAGAEAGDAARIRAGTARNAHAAPDARAPRDPPRATGETEPILLESDAIRRPGAGLRVPEAASVFDDEGPSAGRSGDRPGVPGAHEPVRATRTTERGAAPVHRERDDEAHDPGSPAWIIDADLPNGQPVRPPRGVMTTSTAAVEGGTPGALPSASEPRRELVTLPGRAPEPLPPAHDEPSRHEIAAAVDVQTPDPLPPSSSGRPRREMTAAQARTTEPLISPSVPLPDAAPAPGAPDVITPQTFGTEPRPPARKRAATLPPAQVRRPPTPAPAVSSVIAPPTLPRPPAAAAHSADRDGPIVTPPLTGRLDDRRSRPMNTLRGQVDSDNRATVPRIAPPRAASAASHSSPAVADPPGAADPLRHRSGEIAGTPECVGSLEEAWVTAPRTSASPGEPSRVADARRAAAADLDAGTTEPSLPMVTIADEHRFDLELFATPPAARARIADWSSGLAARIDAAIDSDEWGNETPIVAPSKAELRALLGSPDPTRQQPLDEIALLQRRAAELADRDPPRRSPHPTAEVDPEDIEAAIELAPPARRAVTAHAIGVAKPRQNKPE